MVENSVLWHGGAETVSGFVPLRRCGLMYLWAGWVRLTALQDGRMAAGCTICGFVLNEGSCRWQLVLYSCMQGVQIQ